MNFILKNPWRNLIWRYWYPYLTQAIKDTPIIFLNYGYVDLNPAAPPLKLQEVDEPNRLCLQLYHHLAQTIDLTDLEVMEVSCGHGGGAAYLARYLQPKSMLGVDLNAKAIDFCRRHHHPIKNLAFVRGNAETLQFDNDTFDVIINVEASHCYGDMAQFLGHVARILRPGGYFLFTDFRTRPDDERLRAQLVQSGLEIRRAETITLNVLRAMELASEEKLALIRQFAPRILHKLLKQFSGVKGSTIFKGFQSGEMVYVSYTLQKIRP